MRRPDETLRAVVEARPRVDVGSRSTIGRNEPRRPPNRCGEQVGRIRVVAAEELVAALAGERDLHVLGRELRDEVRRQRGRVGERLVERVRERRKEQRRVGLQNELAMLVP